MRELREPLAVLVLIVILIGAIEFDFNLSDARAK
jgi:hypothetical protein